MPFLTTARGGVDKATLGFAKTLATNGVGFRTIAKLLKELQHVQHYERTRIYYSFAQQLQQTARAARGGRGQCGVCLPQRCWTALGQR